MYFSSRSNCESKSACVSQYLVALKKLALKKAEIYELERYLLKDQMDFIPVAFIDFIYASFLSNPNKEFYTQILYTNIILEMFSEKYYRLKRFSTLTLKKKHFYYEY